MRRKILVAIELDDHSANEVLSKVSSLKSKDDLVHSVHVVNPNAIAYAPDPTMTGTMYLNNYEVAMENARLRLKSLCIPYEILPLDCHVRYGRVAHEVHELLVEDEFDTLMIGSHGWTGWKRILGSRANSILHGVPVDTWIFKVSERKESKENDSA